MNETLNMDFQAVFQTEWTILVGILCIYSQTLLQNVPLSAKELRRVNAGLSQSLVHFRIAIWKDILETEYGDVESALQDSMTRDPSCVEQMVTIINIYRYSR